MNPEIERLKARERLLLAALRVFRCVVDGALSFESEYDASDEELVLAARDMMRAVNHTKRYPAGWFEDAQL
jgi:hypothetical protein